MIEPMQWHFIIGGVRALASSLLRSELILSSLLNILRLVEVVGMTSGCNMPWVHPRVAL